MTDKFISYSAVKKVKIRYNGRFKLLMNNLLEQKLLIKFNFFLAFCNAKWDEIHVMERGF